jgi:hypothetical protein
MACGEGVNWGRPEPIQVPTNIGQSETNKQPTSQYTLREGKGRMDGWMDG